MKTNNAVFKIAFILYLSCCISLLPNTVASEADPVSDSAAATDSPGMSKPADIIEQVKKQFGEQPEQAKQQLERILAEPSELTPQLHYEALYLLASVKMNLFELKQAEVVLKQVEDLIEQSSSPDKLGGLYVLKAKLLWSDNKCEEALVAKEKGINLIDPNDQFLIFLDALDITYYCHYSLGDYPKSINSILEAMPLIERLGSDSQKLLYLKEMAVLSIHAGDYDNAEIYNSEVIDKARKSGDTDILINALLNQSAIFAHREAHTAMEEVLLEAQKLAIENNRTSSNTIVKINLTELYITKEQYEQALATVAEAEKLADEAKLEEYYWYAQVLKGRIYAKKGQLEKGVDIIEESIKKLEELNQNSFVLNMLEALSEIYEESGNHQHALETYKKFKQRSDEFNQQEKEENILELREKFMADRREQEIALLDKENKINKLALEQQETIRNLMIIMAILSILFSVILYNRFLSSKKLNFKLESLNEELNELSMTDTLTQIHNRRFLTINIDSLVAYTIRNVKEYKSSGFAIFILDIDYFKKINDIEGHDAGDTILKEFAARLQNTIREGDMLVRWGGEEFVLIARDITDEAMARFAKRLNDVIADRSFQLANKEIDVTCSIGFCRYPLFIDYKEFTWEKALQLADNCLYKAKDDGRNRSVGVVKAKDACTEDDIDLLLSNFDTAIEKGLVQVTETDKR